MLQTYAYNRRAPGTGQKQQGGLSSWSGVGWQLRKYIREGRGPGKDPAFALRWRATGGLKKTFLMANFLNKLMKILSLT